jgi:hypothetical protein
VTLLEAVLAHVRTLPGEVLVVVDPDGMVRSAEVVQALRRSDVRLISWDEPLMARLAFEDPAPVGGQLIVVDQTYRAATLPADVLARAQRTVEVGAAPLFTPMDPGTIARLEWSDRTKAHELTQKLDGPPWVATQTARYLARHLYRLDGEVATDGPAVLEALLRLHLRPRPAPISIAIAAAFADAVGEPLPDLRVRDAVVDRPYFLEWLDRAWRALTASVDGGTVKALLLADGPRHLLDDYVDAGLLPTMSAGEIQFDPGFGVRADPTTALAATVAAGLGAIEARLQDDVVDWRGLAWQWADVLAAQFAMPEQPSAAFIQTRATLNQRFWEWLPGNYPELVSAPNIGAPTMVHKASGVIEPVSRHERVALVVIDGLSLGLWRFMLPMLRQSSWHVTEAASFAWIPTITSLSRQSIFAGSPPTLFAGSLGTTAREPELWRTWWAEHAHRPAHEIGYLRLHLKEAAAAGGLAAQPTILDQLGRPVLGVVIEDVDHEVHHETLGEGVLYASIRHWVEEGHLLSLLTQLLAQEYVVFLTSDHGFVGVDTIGVSQAGDLADKHGRFERYENDILRQAALAKAAPGTRMPWIDHGLPADYRVLFAPLDGALKPRKGRILTHGGPSLEEVIVPWVEIRQ